MKVAYWTNSLSPHQLPLAGEIARRVGEGNYRYLYRDEPTAERMGLGWDFDSAPSWCRRGTEDDPWLMDADLVYTGGLRPLDLVARRIAAGKTTCYVTERWFKPLQIFGVSLPGRLRMLSPGYRRMARRMVDMLNNPLCRVLTIGPWSKKDMISLGVKESQIVGWGYFVKEGKGKREDERKGKRKEEGKGKRDGLKVLWVGRLLAWKRLDTVIRAVGEISTRSTCSTRLNIALDIYGTGPEEMRLRKLASKYGDAIRFYPPVPIECVRKLMREHDVYVLASNAYEGWGAVVNEALEEGMSVLGTFEAGASAAMLPKERLFNAGDWRGLAGLLAKEATGELPACSIGEWTADKAAERLLCIL